MTLAPITPSEWRALYEANEPGFWRLVRFEARHEPDRAEYFEELERIEEAKERERRRRLAALAPPLEERGPYALPLELALSRLEGVRPSGPGRWSARCPLHDDTTPSLRIWEQEARPGEADVYCHAGCNWRAVKDFLRAPSP